MKGKCKLLLSDDNDKGIILDVYILSPCHYGHGQEDDFKSSRCRQVNTLTWNESSKVAQCPRAGLVFARCHPIF